MTSAPPHLPGSSFFTHSPTFGIDINDETSNCCTDSDLLESAEVAAAWNALIAAAAPMQKSCDEGSPLINVVPIRSEERGNESLVSDRIDSAGTFFAFTKNCSANPHPLNDKVCTEAFSITTTSGLNKDYSTESEFLSHQNVELGKQKTGIRISQNLMTPEEAQDWLSSFQKKVDEENSQDRIQRNKKSRTETSKKRYEKLKKEPDKLRASREANTKYRQKIKNEQREKQRLQEKKEAQDKQQIEPPHG